MQYHLAMSLSSVLILFIVSLFLMFMVFATRESVLGLIFLFVFTFVMGLMTSGTIDLVLKTHHGAQVIALAGLATFSICIGMTLVAMFSKQDFSSLGGLLFGALLMLIVVELANSFFFHSSLMVLVSAIIGALIFSVYILVDVQAVVKGEEDNYIIAALNIYLDVFNLFMNLVEILSDLTDD
jgi:modulator of FtsH protease